VMPLYGDLPADEQDRAVRPARQRKVILATNVAETSVTIDGVVCVIDSGLARIARHSPWTGLPSLSLEPVSRASCAQRAGRAGRTRPGRVIRLYTRHDHDTRRAFELPEIARTDLAGAALELHGAGIAGLGALTWFEPPPAAAAGAAEELLVRLGAIAGGAGATARITALGRRMLRFPVHPRLARIVCEGEARGVAEPAAAIAALLGARDLRVERRGPRAEARVASASDLIDDLDALYDARRHGMRPDRLRRDGLEPATASAVDRAVRQLARIARDQRPALTGADAVDRELQIAILTGFPDARRDEPLARLLYQDHEPRWLIQAARVSTSFAGGRGFLAGGIVPSLTCSNTFNHCLRLASSAKSCVRLSKRKSPFGLDPA